MTSPSTNAAASDTLPPDWRDANRRSWDERVPLHVAGEFYDVPGFMAGASSLRGFELEDLGDLKGRDLVHLQCHFGQDTLSLAREGARVTGLDFSAPAVAAARQLAAEMGLDAHFVEADVYDAPTALGRRFDVVYTGLGALCWLPDLPRWADVVRALVKPGGMVYVVEFHPITDVFAEKDFSLKYPYFDEGRAYVDQDGGSYADLTASTEANLCYCWTHPVSAVMQGLLDRGLRLERFRELDYTLFPRWPSLVKSGRDIYRLPEGTPSLPLMYALRFRAPD